ncbi:MAG: hypothetical protein ACKVTZ_21190 [Bacteroidia bacterium]
MQITKNFFKLLPFSLILLGVLFSSTTFFQKDRPPNDCRRQPAFMSKQGFDLSRSALSTSERKQMGLVMIEMENGNDPNSKRTRIYQHPSWDDAGYLGPFIIDAVGEVIVAPVPVINWLHNPPEEQNTLYKVNGATGQLYKLMKLPMAAPLSHHNPYGLLGLAYDCDNQTVYATSVAGSTRTVECGRIFHVNINTQKVLSQLDSVDAMGIVVGNLQGEKRVYFGKTRTGEIMSIKVDENGDFVGKARTEFSLEGVGTRGDDKARKIRINAQNELIITGAEFYYNLTAPTEKQESVYIFKFDMNRNRWVRTQ